MRRGAAVVVAAVVAAALVTVGAVWSWPLNTAEEWSAVATWVTAGVALAAGAIALSQLGEARRLRLEQAQPYVVAYMEPSPAGAWFIDLVVRNFGATAAHDVRLNIEPAPRRRAGARDNSGKDVWLPEIIPVLVPGQEWRTFWDSGQRGESDLPKRHEAEVALRDSHGKSLPPLRSVLDWSADDHQSNLDVYGVHHAAKALREINKTIAGWRKPGHTGLTVTVWDGDAKDARRRERLEAEEAAQQSEHPDAGL